MTFFISCYVLVSSQTCTKEVQCPKVGWNLAFTRWSSLWTKLPSNELCLTSYSFPSLINAKSQRWSRSWDWLPQAVGSSCPWQWANCSGVTAEWAEPKGLQVPKPGSSLGITGVVVEPVSRGCLGLWNISLEQPNQTRHWLKATGSSLHIFY